VAVVSKVVTSKVPVIVVRKDVTGKLMHEADGKILRYIPSIPLNSNLFHGSYKKNSPAMRTGNLDMKVKFIDSRLLVRVLFIGLGLPNILRDLTLASRPSSLLILSHILN
jgi:hypothetical protein